MVLDVGVQDLDGWQVLEGLQRTELTDRIPVLLLSGVGEGYGLSVVEERGASGLIAKPFMPHDLRTAVAGLLEAS